MRAYTCYTQISLTLSIGVNLLHHLVIEWFHPGVLMKLYFGVKNLRSVDVVPSVELRPITILLGRNNVGKSTFLRTFPLLRQSARVRPIGPVYWKGEFVDFGDYSTAAKNGSENEGITFNFECGNFNIPKNYCFTNQYLTDKDNLNRKVNCINGQAKLQILLQEHNGQVVRKRTLLNIPEFEINMDISFSNSGAFEKILVNNNKLPDYFKNCSFEFQRDRLLPALELYNTENINRSIYTTNAADLEVSKFIVTSIQEEYAKEMKNHELFDIAAQILAFPRLTVENIIDLNSSAIPEHSKSVYGIITNNPSKFIEKFDTICSLYTAMKTYEKIASTFDCVIKNSTYVSPSRARSKRYHEMTNLNFSELRVDGANLPEMLGSLDSKKLTEFSNWLKEYFDFGIHVKKSYGHISIFVKRGDSKVNFADSGFGISQLVPVALQVWWDLNMLGEYSSSPPTKKSGITNIQHESTKILALEQPELHLHPAHQSQLADLFANSVKSARAMKNRIKPAYIIETHSEALVNRLGALIEDGVVAPEDVQILMFSKDNDELTSPTKVEKIEYNNEGYLEDWPYGFFRTRNVN